VGPTLKCVTRKTLRRWRKEKQVRKIIEKYETSLNENAERNEETRKRNGHKRTGILRRNNYGKRKKKLVNK
jgi:hypothetical protein